MFGKRGGPLKKKGEGEGDWMNRPSIMKWTNPILIAS